MIELDNICPGQIWEYRDSSTKDPMVPPPSHWDLDLELGVSPCVCIVVKKSDILSCRGKDTYITVCFIKSNKQSPYDIGEFADFPYECFDAYHFRLLFDGNLDAD